MIFGIKKINNFDPYNVFLAIATNKPQRLKTGFVVQGHISYYIVLHYIMWYYYITHFLYIELIMLLLYGKINILKRLWNVLNVWNAKM